MCAEGTDKQRLEWFKIINIAGVKLTDQELRNAIYTESGLLMLRDTLVRPHALLIR